MAGIVFGLGVTAAACHLPRVPEHRRRQHPPVPDRLGDPLFTAEEPECELWQARQSDPSARAASKESRSWQPRISTGMCPSNWR
jgi:hypothetical protein